jgi:NAD kinase
MDLLTVSPDLDKGQRGACAAIIRQPPILASEILAVTRLSKLECIAMKSGRSVEDLKQELEKGSPQDLLLVESHRRQKEAEALLVRLLGSSRLVPRDQANSENLSSAKLVLSIGGDNHLQYVAQALKDTPVVGVNSDPQLSDGVLCGPTIAELPQFIEDLAQGHYTTEEWTRAEVEVDGRSIGRALCDVACGELHFYEMSKHLLSLRGSQDLNKGSGLLIATGTGSTGWYSSIYRQSGESHAAFPRESPELRFILREPYEGRLPANKIPRGSVGVGDELQIKSLNDSQGIVILDSLVRADFPLGSILKIRISEHPLKVLFPVSNTKVN